jgi:uncharacterized protein (TIGR03083 family)
MLAGAIRSSRDDLVQCLVSLDPDQWDAPSLCEGWRVRDVVAHLVRLGGYLQSPFRYAASAAANGFRPNRYQARDARRVSECRSDVLIEGLRQARYEDTRLWRLHPWPEMTLAELVIHGHDIRWPLGIEYSVPSDQLRLVADLIVRRIPRPFRYPLGGWRLPAARFQAVDVDWSWGTGPVIEGPLRAIVMVLSRRLQLRSELIADPSILDAVLRESAGAR